MTEIERTRGGIGGMTWSSLESSSFAVDRWDQFDFEFLLSSYPRIHDKARRARGKGIDAREIFFALSGKPVTASGPMADSWRAVLSVPAWQKAIAGARDKLDRAAALDSMLDSLIKKADGDHDQMPEADTESPTADVEIVEGVPTSQDAEDAERIKALVAILAGSGAGGIDADTPQKVLDDALMLASHLDIDAFHKLLGFCMRTVRGASRRTRPGRDEMTGYSFSGWSEEVVPQDQLAVARGDLEALVRLAEETLTKRSYDGDRAMGKGPVVLLRDESTSMSWDARMKVTMGPHKRALALEVALAQAFNKDGRDLVTIAWGTESLREHVWGDASYSLKDHLLAFLNASGTHIRPSLVRGLEIADDYVDGADILIVTDGELFDAYEVQADSDLQETLVSYRERGGRVWVVLVGAEEARDSWSKALPFADAIISLDDLADGSADLRAVIAGMANRSKPGSKRVVG